MVGSICRGVLVAGVAAAFSTLTGPVAQAQVYVPINYAPVGMGTSNGGSFLYRGVYYPMVGVQPPAIGPGVGGNVGQYNQFSGSVLPGSRPGYYGNGTLQQQLISLPPGVLSAPSVNQSVNPARRPQLPAGVLGGYGQNGMGYRRYQPLAP